MAEVAFEYEEGNEEALERLKLKIQARLDDGWTFHTYHASTSFKDVLHVAWFTK